MDRIVVAAWLSLAVVHLAPSIVLFAPALTERLYGPTPDGEVGVLVVHRGALFLGIVVAALLAAFDPPSRRLASVVVAVSVLGFLVVYARAGLPSGALRTIALVDAVALLPLGLVGWRAWTS